MRPLTSSLRTTSPRATMCDDDSSVTSTGSSQVLPLVPSTTAAKRVCRWTGWPAMSTWKSGVSVVPSTRMRSRTPWKRPFDDRMPPMPLMVSRLALANCVVGAERRHPRVVGVPRPEGALGVDLALRLGVRQPRLEAGGAIEAEVGHHQIVDVEDARQLGRVVGVDLQPRGARADRVDDDRAIGARGGRGASPGLPCRPCPVSSVVLLARWRRRAGRRAGRGSRGPRGRWSSGAAS